LLLGIHVPARAGDDVEVIVPRYPLCYLPASPLRRLRLGPVNGKTHNI
jgi:hypothetical protein